MSPITTHVLDTGQGRPAVALEVTLYRLEMDGASTEIGRSETDSDGRATDLLPAGSVASGTYRLEFNTAGYFARHGNTTFYPRVDLLFEVAAEGEHYHVPLLLSPYGYTTYRGS